MINFSHLEKITNGKNLLYTDDRQINTLCVDSRKATEDEGTLFFAISGERNDGHDYLRSLYKMGVRQFVVERSLEDLESFAGANILLVSSSIQALQSIAAFHRSQFSIPVDGDHRKQRQNNRQGMVISDLVKRQICCEKPRKLQFTDRRTVVCVADACTSSIGNLRGGNFPTRRDEKSRKNHSGQPLEFLQT